MTFQAEINGRKRTVEILEAPDRKASGTGGRFRLRLQSQDEPDSSAPRLETLDARFTDDGVSLLFDQDRSRSVDVAVAPRNGQEFLLQLPHVAVVATLGGDRHRPGSRAVTGEQRLSAPMPGRIVRVLVRPGDQVDVRQGLIVMEAMKMENELTSLRAGTVKEVAVTEGASVEAGRLLVVVG